MSRFCLAVCLLLAFAAAACISTVVITEAAEPAAWQTAPAVQVTVPPSAYAEAAAAAAAAKTPAATKGFKTALGTAATAAFQEGKITRWQLARLRMAIAFRADAMAEAQACVIDQACSEGVIRSAGDAELAGFDWTSLLAFIKEWLPFILQIISVL